jgi:hypothetical protein
MFLEFARIGALQAQYTNYEKSSKIPLAGHGFYHMNVVNPIYKPSPSHDRKMPKINQHFQPSPVSDSVTLKVFQ